MNTLNANTTSSTSNKATTMTNLNNIRTVSIFTDGSCNVPARTGGWGVHISLDGTDKTKDLSGSVADTTNNLMELEAMLQAIKAVDVSKSGYKYEFNTDSKYVLQIMANQDKYESSNYKKVANTEKVKELFQALSDRGIVLESTTDGSAAFKALQSGGVAHIANGGTVVFKWVKGHSDHPGNDKADKLALKARKLLDKTGNTSSDTSRTGGEQKAVAEVLEAPVAMEVVAEQLAAVMAEPEVGVDNAIVKEDFINKLKDLDAQESVEVLEIEDAASVVHDSNFELWQSRISESSIMKSLVEIFEMELGDVTLSIEAYEDFYREVCSEHKAKTLSDDKFFVAEGFYRWMPSLMQEVDLATLKKLNTPTDPSSRYEANVKFQAEADALDAYVAKQELLASSVAISEPSSGLVDTPLVSIEDLAVVAEYNELNTKHDFTFMFSDDNTSYTRGNLVAKTLENMEETFTPAQKDLVALYNNYVLERNCEQFRKSVTTLIDCIESSNKYFQEGFIIMNKTQNKFVETDKDCHSKFASNLVDSENQATLLTGHRAELIADSLNAYQGDTFIMVPHCKESVTMAMSALLG